VHELGIPRCGPNDAPSPRWPPGRRLPSLPPPRATRFLEPLAGFSAIQLDLQVPAVTSLPVSTTVVSVVPLEGLHSWSAPPPHT
jgi:hypothetical protein